MAVQQAETSFVAWYMTDDVTSRIVVFEWWPVAGERVTDMTGGSLLYKKRDTPDDVWSAGKTIAASVPLIVARRVALSQGFEYEQTTRDDGSVDTVRLDDADGGEDDD